MTDVPLLEAVDLYKAFAMPHGVVEVLTGLSLTVRRGERLCVMGASGTGKSTLLHLLGGLDVPDRGEVRMEGESFHDWRESRRAAFRARRIGIVFQNYHLLPDLDVLENALMPLRALPGGGRISDQDRNRVRERLDAVGLGHRLNHRPVELSGGEQQRLAVARALANEPDLLLADEPTGNLDAATGDRVLDDLFRLGAEGERTLVVVTHDPRLADRCERVVHMRDGGAGAGLAAAPSRIPTLPRS